MNEPITNFNPSNCGFNPDNPLHAAVKDWALAEIESAKLIRECNNL